AYAAKAKRISALTRDLSEILIKEDLEKLVVKQTNRKTAVHCPCSLQHAQQLGGHVEQILQRAGIELSKTQNGHLCCGSAGTYSLLQPTLSQQLLTNKINDLTIDNPDQIVTANIGCQLHLGSHASVPVKHWIELLDPQ
ncbi:heterodisulfide reductase-related iron-sulfur binding cluster, partial [Psychrobacter sp. 16-Bac2893]